MQYKWSLVVMQLHKIPALINNFFFFFLHIIVLGTIYIFEDRSYMRVEEEY